MADSSLMRLAAEFQSRPRLIKILGWCKMQSIRSYVHKHTYKLSAYLKKGINSACIMQPSAAGPHNVGTLAEIVDRSRRHTVKITLNTAPCIALCSQYSKTPGYTSRAEKHFWEGTVDRKLPAARTENLKWRATKLQHISLQIAGDTSERGNEGHINSYTEASSA